MINKATLLGRVGKKDHKTLKNGTTLTSLSLATNRKYIDQQGQKQDKTTWHNVNLFGKLGEIAEKYLAVGDLVYLEGEIDNRKYTDKDGVEKWTFSINANEMKLLPKGKSDENIKSKEPKKENQSILEEEFDDSIPF